MIIITTYYNWINFIGCRYGDHFSWCKSYLEGNEEFCVTKEWVSELCCQECDKIMNPTEEEDPGYYLFIVLRGCNYNTMNV